MIILGQILSEKVLFILRCSNFKADGGMFRLAALKTESIRMMTHKAIPSSSS